VTQILSADWVLPVEGEPIEDGAIAISDGRIAAVGPAAELGRGQHHAGAAIVPGFVNAHTHLEYAVYGAFGDGLSFAPWLATHIERKARIDRDDMEAIARLGAAECLASGVTTVGDASFAGASAHACADLGLRAIVYLEVFGRDPEDALSQYGEKLEYVQPVLSERVGPGVSPHAPYSCTTEVYAACLSLGVPVMTHFNESSDELDWLLRGEGPMRPVGDILVDPDGQTGIRRLAAAGLLTDRILAAHCVKVDAEEIGLLAANDVAVAHCPRSNALLGCGIAPLPELLAAGLRVGIGTDGVSSVPSHDFFDELRAVISAARARTERADALSPAAVLELATLGGARALGLDPEIGSLVPGKQADLAVVSLAGTSYLPWEDPAAAVVYGGGADRIAATLVAGLCRYESGRYVQSDGEKGGTQWPELIADASRARGRLLREAAPDARPTTVAQ
jgi:5-methylthioadenosine/S-adenosylhomocysteine deaminase